MWARLGSALMLPSLSAAGYQRAPVTLRPRNLMCGGTPATALNTDSLLVVNAQVRATQRVAALAMRLVGAVVGKPPLRDTVSHVLAARPDEQMIRITATRIIAAVAYIKMSCNRPVQNFNNVAVHGAVWPLYVGAPIPPKGPCTVPLPATVATALAYCVNAPQKLADFHVRNIAHFSL